MNNFSLKQSFIMIQDELVHLISRKRALFAFFLYAGMLLAVFWTIDQSKNFFQNMLDSLVLSQGDKAMLMQLNEEINLSAKAKENVPFLNLSLSVLIYYFVSVMSIPLLIPMISCDMISKDLARGTQRFLLFRISRPVYYISRGISHLLIYIILQFAVLFTTFISVMFFLPDDSLLKVVAEGFAITLRLIPIIMAFLALTQLISAFCSSAIKSLIFCNIVLVIMVVILAFQPVFSLFYPPLWQGLFSLEFKIVSVSMMGFILWSIIFWSLGFLFFERRQM